MRGFTYKQVFMDSKCSMSVAKIIKIVQNSISVWFDMAAVHLSLLKMALVIHVSSAEPESSVWNGEKYSFRSLI